MPRVYNVDVDVDVQEVWDACSSRERDELMSLVVEEYDLIDPTLDDATVVGLVTNRILRPEFVSPEAKEHIRTVIEQLERDVRDRNFKPLC